MPTLCREGGKVGTDVRMCGCVDGVGKCMYVCVGVVYALGTVRDYGIREDGRGQGEARVGMGERRARGVLDTVAKVCTAHSAI